MITPSTIYWLTRCDAIKDLIVFLVLVSLLFNFIGLVGFVASEMSGGEIANPFGRRFYKTVIAMLSATLLAITFLPTTKEMAAIIVVPRIANSESIQQLGDGIVNLTQDWMRNLAPKKVEPAQMPYEEGSNK